MTFAHVVPDNDDNSKVSPSLTGVVFVGDKIFILLLVSYV